MFGVPAKEAKYAKETKRQTQVNKVETFQSFCHHF